VIGRPVGHSLSPLLHGAWIAAAGLDAVYAPFAPTDETFAILVHGLCAGGVCGVNVTLPFKQQALALAEIVSLEADDAGAANLLLFGSDGRIEARNTDGLGLLRAFREQAPTIDLSSGPVVILGAGGAARGAASALKTAGVQDLRIVNRTPERAAALADRFEGRAFAVDEVGKAFAGVVAVINATSAGLDEAGGPDWPLEAAPRTAAVMDMLYRPLMTPLLRRASGLGMPTVDGLAMLIGQAKPSFEALFGIAAPAEVDARTLLERALA
jgi:shikimate dehydrogenase